jgi:RNA recognition motif-containing protein
MGTKLEVSNFPIEFSEKDIEGLSEVLEVVDVSIPHDRESGKGRSLASVTMVSAEAAQKAVNEMDGYMLNGMQLRVRLMRDRPMPGGRPARTRT